jgi:ribulose 1,5-bisphosphate synthetase/thiazole synthase
VIKQALQFVTDKRRLITEYALLGCVVAIGGLAFSMWISRSEIRTELANTKVELEAQKERVMVTEQAYQTNREAVTALQNLRKLDDVTFAELHQSLARIQASNTLVDKQLQLMKVQNEEVKVFFRTSLNTALICVLEPQQCGHKDVSAN